MRSGLRRSGFGFLFQGYTDDPDGRAAGDSEVGEGAPLLRNRQVGHLDEITEESERGPWAGSIVDPSID